MELYSTQSAINSVREFQQQNPPEPLYPKNFTASSHNSAAGVVPGVIKPNVLKTAIKNIEYIPTWGVS